jgi:hypothetical protein
VAGWMPRGAKSSGHLRRRVSWARAVCCSSGQRDDALLVLSLALRKDDPAKTYAWVQADSFEQLAIDNRYSAVPVRYQSPSPSRLASRASGDGTSLSRITMIITK